MKRILRSRLPERLADKVPPLVGTRLISMFVKQLRADHEFSSDDSGARHLITFPV